MTENEAINVLQLNRPFAYSELQNAIDMAIKALEEIQQYRDMGTVEEILRVFNSQRRIIAAQHETLKQYRAIGTVEDLKSLKENGAFTGVELAQIAAMQIKLKEYQSIGTVEECRTAVERMKLKKPRKIRSEIFDSIINYYCPNCGRRFGERGDHNAILFKKELYCNGEDCGQAIDWNE